MRSPRTVQHMTATDIREIPRAETVPTVPHWIRSTVVAVEPVADDLVAKITERMSTLRIGDGRRSCGTGPVGGPREQLRRRPRLDQLWSFGNGTAIFTNDGGAARRYQNEIEVGMIGINVPTRCRLPRSPSAAGRLAVRRHQGSWRRGFPLLHPTESGHLPLAGPQPRRDQPGLSTELTAVVWSS
jgi:hypothetical protein